MSILENSYSATVRAKSGTLLGGVRKHESSRFKSYGDAIRWAETVIEINRGAGRDVDGSWTITTHRGV